MDRIELGNYYSIDFLKEKGLLNAPSFRELYNLAPTKLNTNQIPNSLKNDTSVVVKVVKKSLSISGDAALMTTYRDDYIVRGQSFANENTRTVTAGTEFFVLDFTNCSCSQVFKLPILVNPSAGYVVVNLYEDTDYTGDESLAFFNRNRLSAQIAGTTLTGNATGNTKGAFLFGALFGGEQTNQNAGGEAGSSANSLVLDITKKYLFEVTYSENCTIGYNMEIAEI